MRQAWTITDPDLISALRTSNNWPQLDAFVKSRQNVVFKDKHSIESRYFIASFQGTAAELLGDARIHWTIENSLHWVLDISFREDECRLRKGHGAQNFAILRHIALNLLKQDDRLKVGIKNKQLQGWLGPRLLALRSPTTLYFT